MKPIENLNMYELKEVARLYTAKDGYKLVVGKFDHPVDAERTAAKAYYHLTEEDGTLYVGNTMKKLRTAIERGETVLVKDHLNLIEIVLDGRREAGKTETQTYNIDVNFKKATAA